MRERRAATRLRVHVLQCGRGLVHLVEAVQLHARGQAAQRRVLPQDGGVPCQRLQETPTPHAQREQAAVSRTSAVRTYTAFGAVVSTSQASLVSKPGAPAPLRVSCATELRCMPSAALTGAQANDSQAAGRAARRSRAAQRPPPPDARVRHQTRAHGHADLRAHASCHPKRGRKRTRSEARSRLPAPATSSSRAVHVAALRSVVRTPFTRARAMSSFAAAVES